MPVADEKVGKRFGVVFGGEHPDDVKAFAPSEAAADGVKRVLEQRAHFGIRLSVGGESLLQQAGDRALAAAAQLHGGG